MYSQLVVVRRQLKQSAGLYQYVSSFGNHQRTLESALNIRPSRWTCSQRYSLFCQSFI